VLRELGRAWELHARSTCPGRVSESKDGTKRDPQVVVRAAIEVNRVAKFQPQPDWTQSCFYANAWIEYRVNTGGMDAEGGTQVTFRMEKW
jgi:hypothetical protein